MKTLLIRHFYSCFDKILFQSTLRREGFILAYRSGSQSGRGQHGSSSHDIHSQEAEGDNAGWDSYCSLSAQQDIVPHQLGDGPPDLSLEDSL